MSRIQIEGAMLVKVFTILCAATFIVGAAAVAVPLAGVSECTSDEYPLCLCNWYHENLTAILYQDGKTAVSVHLNLPRLQRTALFLLARFAINLEYPAEGSFDVTETHNENATLPYRTWIATTSQLYNKLSPLLFDALSLGMLSLDYRTNESDLTLPAPVCDGKEEEILAGILASILENSEMDMDEWIVKEQETLTTLQTSEVFLFMSTGLLSVFAVFITAPFCILVISHTRCCKKKQIQCDENCGVYLSALFLLSAFLFPAFLAYWILVSVCYYTDDKIAKYLFYDQLLAPFSLNLIFYSLTGLVSFIGGFSFSKCRQSGSVKMSYCSRIGFGLLSVSVSASVYHSFFVALAFLQDVVTVTSSLVSFVTIIVLMFLGMCAIMNQFLKTRLNGSTMLVTTLMVIILVLYIISVKSFGTLLLEEDSYVATPAWLLMVTLLSMLALSFVISVFVLVLKQQPIARNNNRSTQQPSQTNSSNQHNPPGDVESGCQPTADSTALVKLPKDLVAMLPVVVNAWRTREKERKSPNK